ncbi:hypothetical protein NC653_011097 [Populus alba x Populus x berolinensis]|uniref:Uncharacterized protein n=1 Tax=Populus alba x Populus x berolinensis TaxID=444605 RepID=A0AAD6R2H1_9ROSI|nr:hypothetical protein NC653_011097 [Populus alba x Populus x berolinensis]
MLAPANMVLFFFLFNTSFWWVFLLSLNGISFMGVVCFCEFMIFLCLVVFFLIYLLIGSLHWKQ